MNYQRKRLADGSLIGEPGPLPADLRGLSDDTLANLSAFLDPDACNALGYQGQGFFVSTRDVTSLAFKYLLTPQERIAIRVASATDPIVADFLDLLATAPLVNLDFQGTKDGVAYLVSQNLLTEERAAAILA